MISLYSYSSDYEIPEDIQVCAVGLYAHGELQVQLGYDVIAPKILEDTTPIKLTELTENGIYDAVVHGVNGAIPCKLYYWQLSREVLGTLTHRGLAVLPEDTKSVEYAEQMLSERAWTL